jgi:hypothetical protein
VRSSGVTFDDPEGFLCTCFDRAPVAIRTSDCGGSLRYLPVPVGDLKQHTDRRQFAGECLFEFGSAVIAHVAATVLDNQVAAERRWEDLLIREADCLRLPLPQAEQALRHTGILIWGNETTCDHNDASSRGWSATGS